MKANDLERKVRTDANTSFWNSLVCPILLIVVSLFVAVHVIWYPLKEFRTCGGASSDFCLRYHELECIKTGVDPFDIWSGAVVSDRFHPLNQPSRGEGSHHLHAYPAWAYTYFYPFSLMPRRMAYRSFVVLEIGALALLLAWAFKRGRRAGHSWKDGCIALVAFGFCGHGFVAAWASGNYSWFVLFALSAMSICLNRGKDVVAGMFLGLAMTKPQMAALFVVPLLLSGKWKTLLAGMAVCLLATIPPALVLHKSPIDLVLQIPKIGSGFVDGTLLLPPFVFRFVKNAAGQGASVAASALLGVALCVAETRRVKGTPDWFVKLLPAALLSPAWTYCMEQDTVLYAWANLALWLFWLKTSDSKVKATAPIAVLLLASSWIINLSPAYSFGKLFFVPPTDTLPWKGETHLRLVEIIHWLQRGGTVLSLWIVWRLFKDRFDNQQTQGSVEQTSRHS